ncbi:MAG TPA: Hpt domain-containing protein, partial [Candidatus Cybelea sp.]|nr:Hpt domain-containing protein [Candidatus Cybelea sp.]
MPIDISQFFDGFFDEVAEHLTRIEELLVEIENAAPEPERLHALFRAAHSIKGASGTFGFSEMSTFTHVLESLLGSVRDGKVAVSRTFVDAVLAAVDVLREQLAAYRAQEKPADALAETARKKLQALLDEGCAAVRSFRIAFRTDRDANEAQRSISALDAELAQLGRCDEKELTATSLTCTLTGSRTLDEIEDVFAYVSLDGDELEIEEISPAQPEPAAFGF